MAADRPRPGRSNGPGPGIYDHTLWMLLLGYVAHRPRLPAVIAVIDPSPERLAQRQIKTTAGDLLVFADKVEGILALQQVPGGVGSARAVATAVVRMCREFAERWSDGAPVTSSLMAGFEREIDVVETTLEAIAARSST